MPDEKSTPRAASADAGKTFLPDDAVPDVGGAAVDPEAVARLSGDATPAPKAASITPGVDAEAAAPPPHAAPAPGVPARLGGVADDAASSAPLEPRTTTGPVSPQTIIRLAIYTVLAVLVLVFFYAWWQADGPRYNEGNLSVGTAAEGYVQYGDENGRVLVDVPEEWTSATNRQLTALPGVEVVGSWDVGDAFTGDLAVIEVSVRSHVGYRSAEDREESLRLSAATLNARVTAVTTVATAGGRPGVRADSTFSSGSYTYYLTEVILHEGAHEVVVVWSSPFGAATDADLYAILDAIEIAE